MNRFSCVGVFIGLAIQMASSDLEQRGISVDTTIGRVSWIPAQPPRIVLTKGNCTGVLEPDTSVRLPKPEFYRFFVTLERACPLDFRAIGLPMVSSSAEAERHISLSLHVDVAELWPAAIDFLTATHRFVSASPSYSSGITCEVHASHDLLSAAVRDEWLTSVPFAAVVLTDRGIDPFMSSRLLDRAAELSDIGVR